MRFVTTRYGQNPLVVQGPGAGPAVTAGGVFADLLRVCAYLGAKNLTQSARTWKDVARRFRRATPGS